MPAFRPSTCLALLRSVLAAAHSRAPAILTALLWGMVVAGPVGAQDVAEPETDEETAGFHEWTIPWQDARPTDLAVTSAGVVWFLEEGHDHLGVLEPEIGQIHRFVLPEGTGPLDLHVDPEGFPWFTGSTDRMLGRLDPASGELLRYELPDPLQTPLRLAGGGGGVLWFTATGADDEGFLGRMTVQSGEMVARGFGEALEMSVGPAVDVDGRPWALLPGSGLLVRLDPETLDETRVALPDGTEGSPARLAVGEGGAVWWLDPDRGVIARFNGSTGDLEEWEVWDVDGGTPDRLLGVETGSPILVASREPIAAWPFDPLTGEIGATIELPVAAGEISALHLDPSSGMLWIATTEGSLARIPIDGADLP